MKPLPRSFYERDTVLVAQELIGKVFICTLATKPFIGRIVETEAYRSDDPACHAYRGLTNRNQALFGPVGHTYVYLCYGIHWCMNIVARNTEVRAGGVLVRAIEQLTPSYELLQRIDGPGRVAKALFIQKEHAGIDVAQDSSSLVLYDTDIPSSHLLQVTPRIGISQGVDKLWRFVAR